MIKATRYYSKGYYLRLEYWKSTQPTRLSLDVCSSSSVYYSVFFYPWLYLHNQVSVYYPCVFLHTQASIHIVSFHLLSFQYHWIHSSNYLSTRIMYQGTQYRGKHGTYLVKYDYLPQKCHENK